MRWGFKNKDEPYPKEGTITIHFAWFPVYVFDGIKDSQSHLGEIWLESYQKIYTRDSNNNPWSTRFTKEAVIPEHFWIMCKVDRKGETL